MAEIVNVYQFKYMIIHFKLFSITLKANKK